MIYMATDFSVLEVNHLTISEKILYLCTCHSLLDLEVHQGKEERVLIWENCGLETPLKYIFLMIKRHLGSNCEVAIQYGKWGFMIMLMSYSLE